MEKFVVKNIYFNIQGTGTRVKLGLLLSTSPFGLRELVFYLNENGGKLRVLPRRGRPECAMVQHDHKPDLV